MVFCDPVCVMKKPSLTLSQSGLIQSVLGRSPNCSFWLNFPEDLGHEMRATVPGPASMEKVTS